MSRGAGETYETLRDQAAAAAHHGCFQEARELVDQALAEANRRGDRPTIDRALCNRAAVLIELGQAGAGVKQDLREILLRNADAESAFLASYSLARAHDLEGEFDKALFYARIAQRRACELGSSERLASSHNQIGNLLLAQSDFDRAQDELEEALALMPQAPSVRRAVVLDSLGYCLIVRGRFRKGFSALVESVRTAVRLGARAVEGNARLALAFGYLQIGRPYYALRHARRSLARAEQAGDRGVVKYGLFVLGEAEKMCGNPLAAHRCFSRLQEEYYPDTPNVAELLLLLNVQNLINLKA